MSIHDKYHRDGAQLVPRPFPNLWSFITISASGSLYRFDKQPSFGYSRRVGEALYVHTFDIRRTDREYWHQTKLFLEWCAQALERGSRDWAKDAYKTLRKLHHESKAKEWDAVLPPAIVAWANGRLASAAEGEPCCDNWRVARVGNTAQVRRYKSQKKAGCCGFADFVEMGPDGKRYMLGFNYGH